MVRRYESNDGIGNMSIQGQCRYLPIGQRVYLGVTTATEPACHAWEAMPDEPGPEHWWKEKR